MRGRRTHSVSQVSHARSKQGKRQRQPYSPGSPLPQDTRPPEALHPQTGWRNWGRSKASHVRFLSIKPGGKGRPPADGRDPSSSALPPWTSGPRTLRERARAFAGALRLTVLQQRRLLRSPHTLQPAGHRHLTSVQQRAQAQLWQPVLGESLPGDPEGVLRYFFLPSFPCRPCSLAPGK